MTSVKCETYLYLTLNVLGRTKKNIHLLEHPRPAYRYKVISNFNKKYGNINEY
jgi:hypothetical protein